MSGGHGFYLCCGLSAMSGRAYAPAVFFSSCMFFLPSVGSSQHCAICTALNIVVWLVTKKDACVYDVYVCMCVCVYVCMCVCVHVCMCV